MLIHSVDAYLALRRAAGFKLRFDGILLHSFARFAARRALVHVRTDAALEWAKLGPSAGARERRLRTLAAFAQHARAEDASHEVPPTRVFASRCSERRCPHIYSPEEIGLLLQAAARLGPDGSLRGATYSTLFGLLACTGLRISEALRLQLRDVTADGLVVRETKFRKSRLVPLHVTADAALRRYLGRRNAFATCDDHVFISRRKRALSYTTVLETFLGLARDIGLPQAPRDRRPRIHDLRHTFAVRSLESCSGGRDHVGRHMVGLSTYLGHCGVRPTYWYFHSTPQLMADMADACEAFLSGGWK